VTGRCSFCRCRSEHEDAESTDRSHGRRAYEARASRRCSGRDAGMPGRESHVTFPPVQKTRGPAPQAPGRSPPGPGHVLNARSILRSSSCPTVWARQTRARARSGKWLNGP
jgi:hypothetical protein